MRPQTPSRTGELAAASLDSLAAAEAVRPPDGKIPGIGGRGDPPRGRTPGRGSDSRRGPAKPRPDPARDPGGPAELPPADPDPGDPRHIDLHVGAAARAARGPTHATCTAL